jgi:uncharacterized protein with FMN-binding domain
MNARRWVAIGATIVGIVMILRFKTPAGQSAAALRSPTVQQSQAPAGEDQGEQPATEPSAPATQPAPASSGYKDGSFTGQPIDTRFGTIQVQAIISGHRISDVKALQLPFDHERSLFISQQAEPILHDEVLQSQSAQIDLLSGATYTSQAYAESLQSALDQARA